MIELEVRKPQKIYLLRHASYAPVFVDGKGGLTPKGRNEVADVGLYLNGLKKSIDKIYSSPVLRTKETGEMIARLLAIPFQISKSLAPGGDLEELFLELEAEGGDFLLVSHSPVIKKILDRFSLEIDNIGLATLICVEVGIQKADLLWFKEFYINN